MTGAARASSLRGTRKIRNGHWLGRGIFAVVLAEFGRAVAAARRYEHLRYGSGRHEGTAPADIPRRIFEEFYSHGRPAQSRRAGWVLKFTWRRSDARREADRGEGVKS